MAGKSNKGRNRRGSHSATNSSEPVGSSDSQMKDNVTASGANQAEANGVMATAESNSTNSEVKESETANTKDGSKQGEVSFTFSLLHLSPVICWLPMQKSWTSNTHDPHVHLMHRHVSVATCSLLDVHSVDTCFTYFTSFVLLLGCPHNGSCIECVHLLFFCSQGFAVII